MGWIVLVVLAFALIGWGIDAVEAHQLRTAPRCRECNQVLDWNGSYGYCSNTGCVVFIKAAQEGQRRFEAWKQSEEKKKLGAAVMEELRRRQAKRIVDEREQ
jgi:hypothetical protein